MEKGKSQTLRAKNEQYIALLRSALQHFIWLHADQRDGSLGHAKTKGQIDAIKAAIPEKKYTGGIQSDQVFPNRGNGGYQNG